MIVIYKKIIYLTLFFITFNSSADSFDNVARYMRCIYALNTTTMWVGEHAGKGQELVDNKRRELYRYIDSVSKNSPLLRQNLYLHAKEIAEGQGEIYKNTLAISGELEWKKLSFNEYERNCK